MASSIRCGSSSAAFIAIRNVRAVDRGERNRGSTDVAAGAVAVTPTVPDFESISCPVRPSGKVRSSIPMRSRGSRSVVMASAPGGDRQHFDPAQQCVVDHAFAVEDGGAI
jgi:hypothetical protein